MSEKLIILAATGQNFANLPPLFELYQANDQVLILESTWAHNAGRTKPLLNFLKQKNIKHSIQMVPDDLAEMMKKVSKLCKPHANKQMVIIANGNTKLFTLALYEALREYQPALAYGEREPQMSYFPKGIRGGCDWIAYEHELDFPDILTVQGQHILEAKDQRPVKRIWFKGQCEIDPTKDFPIGSYAEDPKFTIGFHDAKHFNELSKSGLKITDHLHYIRSHMPEKWNAMVLSSLSFAESCGKFFQLKNINVADRQKAKAVLEKYIIACENNSALPELYKTLQEYYLRKSKNTKDAPSDTDWLLKKLNNTALLNAFYYYLRLLLQCYGVEKATASDPSLKELFLKTLEKNSPDNALTEQFSEALTTMQVRMVEIGLQLLQWIQHSPDWLNQFRQQDCFKKSIGPIFEDYVSLRVLKWLEACNLAKQVVQSVWINAKIIADNEKIPHSELDILLMLKNGILIHLECKSADADKKDLDARVTNLSKLGILSKQVVCLPLYSDHWDAYSYQNMMKTFAEKNLGLNIEFIAMDLPNQHQYVEIQSGNLRFIVKPFDEALTNLLEPYRLY